MFWLRNQKIVSFIYVLLFRGIHVPKYMIYNRTTHVTYHININPKIMHIMANYELTELYPPNIHIICKGEQQRLTRVCASAKSSDNT